MSLAVTQVRDIFTSLETGDGGEFFSHVADDVDWIVEGTHPRAGHYHSKAHLLADTFSKNLRRSCRKARSFTYWHSLRCSPIGRSAAQRDSVTNWGSSPS